MRSLVIILFVFLPFTSINAQDEVVRLSEPVVQTEAFETFGSALELDEKAEIVSLDKAIETIGSEGEVFIKATIKQVCAKKGCFFIAEGEKSEARVTFVDYSFFIPTNSTGKEVVFRGNIEEKVLSTDQAKHYAEDAGEDPDQITEEQKEYAIVASSIRIPKTK
ncbi:MAG: DUF4920 domain-containing protein [Balneolaceae bacterium]|nr:DUF4920 domain-containing protein [Balneolaceae bacterium]